MLIVWPGRTGHPVEASGWIARQRAANATLSGGVSRYTLRHSAFVNSLTKAIKSRYPLSMAALALPTSPVAWNTSAQARKGFNSPV